LILWKGNLLNDHADGEPFLRHIRACNNADLPGGRLPFRIGEETVGWVKPELAAALERCPDVTRQGTALVLRHPQSLPDIARNLSQRGFLRLRHEMFDVRADPKGPVLAQIDRGALPVFGIQASGVHVNGLVQRADGLYLWVARRARDKHLDPGKLDHIVAGGIAAGMDALDTLIKEAAEEASIPAERARKATAVGEIRYAMERAEGLRRDCLYCFDLTLPETLIPRADDGEVESFQLWPIERVLDAVRSTDDFKFNVNLVLIDLFLRRGLIGGAAAARLRARL
jgi:8-oxo-dGTP pyrophosphatase MutT (NUDIX family)